MLDEHPNAPSSSHGLPECPPPECRHCATGLGDVPVLDVHVACTEFLTAMHAGDRTKEATDAGGILPGYTGTIVRDGYKGYEHLTDALHAWWRRARAARLDFDDYRDKTGKGLVAVQCFTGRGITAQDLDRIEAADIAFRIVPRS
jgi:hypothetical protein